MPANAPRQYTATRFYPRFKGGPSHAEARYAANKRRERNLELPDVATAMAQTAPRDPAARVQLTRAQGRRLLPAPWLGKELGSGGYGTAYRVTITPALEPTIRQLRGAVRHAVVGAGMPGAGETVIIKVAKRGSAPLDAFVRDNVKENSMHKYLSGAPCKTHPDLAVPVCASRYVPRLYFAGLVRDSGSGRDVYVAVMSLAAGTTLDDHLRATGRVTADLYVRVERAICTLWINGLVHGDMHKGNVMYDRAGQRVTVIDFGFGVLLPPALAQRVQQAIVQGVAAGVRSLGELWRSSRRSRIGTGLQAYANRVIYTRKKFGHDDWDDPWYNPDGGALTALYSRMSVAERARVPALRRALWGFKGRITVAGAQQGRVQGAVRQALAAVRRRRRAA